ncbi:hypothetical protein ONZ51_g1092 [Trametes cubensis]|uniref:Uncharacterized protein n=1 Tax=Trametes cubensis TaxID=1111947 RepID=A0AAD7U3L2_9APHY|nr:hypothetical protein ONZ51_g1092 [Trametes cubensis]
MKPRTKSLPTRIKGKTRAYNGHSVLAPLYCGLRERYISDFDELEGGRGSPGATSSIFNLATLAHPDLLFSLSGITYRKLPVGQQQPPPHWICALDPGCSSRCTPLTGGFPVRTAFSYRRLAASIYIMHSTFSEA